MVLTLPIGLDYENILSDRVAMPKQKTHKGIRKRVKVTASGKIKHRRTGGGHLLSHKSSKQRRSINKTTVRHSSTVATSLVKLGK